MKIGGHQIDRNNPFIIAEMSGNHNQSLERALEIVDAAADAGAHALKLQTYSADTITLNINRGEFLIGDKSSLWSGESLHSLYTKAATPWEWHEPIMARARERNMICFSSPFDETAVDFLETLNVPAYKIASFEIVHLPLIRKAASTGKPLVMSTGMASISEIDEAVTAARLAGCKDLVLLKCTSTYPASPANSNLNTIPVLKEMFQCEVGLSDHTMGVGVSSAVALAPSVIEKHLTLRRDDGGVDSTFSLEPDELRELVIETKRTAEALGEVSFGPTEAEKKSLIYRRSLYVARDLKAGDILDPTSLRCVRPGLGLPPKYFETVLNSQVVEDISAGTPLSWNHLLK